MFIPASVPEMFSSAMKIKTVIPSKLMDVTVQNKQYHSLIVGRHISHVLECIMNHSSVSLREDYSVLLAVCDVSEMYL
jgi:hypothetical protein